MAVRADYLFFDNMGYGSFVGCGSQDWVMGFEDGFCFQETQDNDMQRKGAVLPVLGFCDNQAAAFSSSSSFSCSAPLSMEFLQCLSSEAEKHELEMNRFLHLEGQRLRSLMQEATRKQALVLQKHYESRIKFLMQQLSNARNREKELQDSLQRAEMDAKVWERKATEKESIIFALNNELNQFKQKEHSICHSSSSSSSSSTKDEKNTEEFSRKICCKVCEARWSCVVLFPCKHLCCCKACEPLLGHCPVCGTLKEASLEVFLSPQKTGNI